MFPVAANLPHRGHNGHDQEPKTEDASQGRSKLGSKVRTPDEWGNAEPQYHNHHDGRDHAGDCQPRKIRIPFGCLHDAFQLTVIQRPTVYDQVHKASIYNSLILNKKLEKRVTHILNG